MKTIRLTLLWIYCLATMAHGGSVVIAWDKSPTATGYRVWQGIRLVKSVSGTQATITLPDRGVSTLGVSAYNAAGESPVTEIHLVAVVVQKCNELRTWRRLTTLYVEREPSMFFRLTPPAL